MIDEARILRRIEHFEHRCGRVPRTTAVRHLVDLVDHDDGIPDIHAAKRLQQQAGHRADVRAPMATDLGFIAHATDGDAIELAPDRGRDGFAERRFTGPRWTDKTEDGTRRISTAKLAHREVFDDAFLCFVESVVFVTEGGFDARQRDLLIVRCPLVPGQGEDPVEIGAQHLILAGCRRQHAKAFRLATRFLHDLLGQVRFLDAAQQLDRLLLVRIRLAELRLNRP